MDALAQLITEVAVALAVAALAHLGLSAGCTELGGSRAENERVIKRSHTPVRPYTPVNRPV